jgi:NodT family efflux transporter outer membrane factor (OMF) lipoprotein
MATDRHIALSRPGASALQLAFVLCITAALGFPVGCDFAPSYHRPWEETPKTFKELTPQELKKTDGWKVAQPREDTIRGAWWELFDDPQLNALEEKVNVSNQTIAAATANFFAARAMVKEAQSQLYPTLTGNLSIVNQRSSAVSSNSQSSYSGTEYSLPFDASWTPDLWGSVRNTIKASAYGAQASAAELENTRLTIQTEVAEDYFELRGEDALKKILDSTVTAYQQSSDLTKALFETGIDTNQAVTQAQALLQTTQAQDTAVGIQRAQYEHAIATLTGQPASSFSLANAPLDANPPAIPFGVPSELLERRPDIAQAERLVAQANAQIGVQKAAFFPTVTLSASAGFESSSLSHWLTWPSRFFSVGPSVSQPLFDAGLRRATLNQYEAQYDETVANYRQTVLTAFQQVEDNLAALRILSQEIDQQAAAVKSSQDALTQELDRYKLGLDPYLNVLTAQNTLLANEEQLLTLHIQQMTSSGALIEALGGGWDAKLIPTTQQMDAAVP